MLWLGIDVGLVFVATALVNFGEPIAAGSGIPEVSVYAKYIQSSFYICAPLTLHQCR